MSASEILVIIFSAVSAICCAAAVILFAMAKKRGGSDSVSPDARSVVEPITQEIDFARRSIMDSSAQINKSYGDVLRDYLTRAENQTVTLSNYLANSLDALARAEKENAARTDEVLAKNLEALKTEFRAGIADMRKELSENVEKMRADSAAQLKAVRDDNEKQLEKMRVTVEEKLGETLEKRVEIAFKSVSERLDGVQRGFGEMKELTDKVGNLNRMFSNVKTRGTWGEVALQSLLEQILSPEQYVAQCYLTRGSREAVDFAVVMPGQAGDTVYLPIDAKFPLEDYQRLLDAGDRGDNAAVEFARKALRERVKNEAKSINDKYIKPPTTTNFAVMYVPNEGLYAEILRDGALISEMQNKHHVTVCGPTTIAALLNSLQVGFTTLKIQKKSAEIVNLMQAVRTDFGKFTVLIEKVRSQAQTVVNTVESMETRNRILTKKLDKLGDDMPPEYLAGDAAASLDAPDTEGE